MAAIPIISGIAATMLTSSQSIGYASVSRSQFPCSVYCRRQSFQQCSFSSFPIWKNFRMKETRKGRIGNS